MTCMSSPAPTGRNPSRSESRAAAGFSAPLTHSSTSRRTKRNPDTSLSATRASRRSAGDPSSRSILATLTEVQRVPLIILDGELSRSPGGLVHVLHETDSVSPQRVRCGLGILRLEIEVEMFARVRERDGGVPFVREFQVKDLIPRPDSRVEVLVLELERQSDLRRVETY